jgi:hypothetical protein
VPQIAGRSANAVARLSLPVIVIGIALAFAFFFWLVRSPSATGEGRTPTQPILFSHAIHAGELHLDCRYCHTSVETSAFAGMPPTQTCMNCHNQILKDSPLLEPLHKSWETGEPIQWVRVNNLPDFAYFDHAAHVTNGVGCVSCHGRVDQMEQLSQVHSLTMGWCITCHMDPQQSLRPLDKVFDPDYQLPPDHEALQQSLMGQLGVQSKTSCSTCHR